jgi:hypothetical protein
MAGEWRREEAFLDASAIALVRRGEACVICRFGYGQAITVSVRKFSLLGRHMRVKS